MSATSGTDSFAGPVLALTTAVAWAISPMFMASAGRRSGSFPVTLLRMLIAVGIYGIAVPMYAALAPSIDWPGGTQIVWLFGAGAVGMMIGDLLIYEAYVTLGTRRTIQALTGAPVVSSVLAYFFLNEVLTLRMIVGIAMVVTGTCYAILRGSVPALRGASTEPGRVTRVGLLCAGGGAVFMGIGAVLTRQAFRLGPIDPLVATAIRVTSGFVCLWMIPILRGTVARTTRHLRDPFFVKRIVVGTLIGPTVGMLCYVSALKYTETGLVSTLVATSPLVAIPITAARYHTRITIDTILAAIVAFAGVAMICL